ncbi:MAG: hypothetical protein SFU98_08815 [Leptospiraceae bacterium]|nr:hypothetical protein [Leptospiraceae bacterium]
MNTDKEKLFNFDLTTTQYNENTMLILTIIANDQTRIVLFVTAVLLNFGWDIMEANFEVMGDRKVKEIFIIRNEKEERMTASDLKMIHNDLDSLLSEKISIKEYQTRLNYKKNESDSYKPQINIFNPKPVDSTVLDIRTKDRPGLLFSIALILVELQIDLISVTAKTDSSNVRDSFLLRKNGSSPLDESEIEVLLSKLEKVL